MKHDNNKNNEVGTIEVKKDEESAKIGLTHQCRGCMASFLRLTMSGKLSLNTAMVVATSLNTGIDRSYSGNFLHFFSIASQPSCSDLTSSSPHSVDDCAS